MKQLLKLMCFDGTDNYSCLSLFCSMSILINPDLKRPLQAEFESCGVRVTEVSIDDLMLYHHELNGVEIEVLEMYDEAITAHYVYAVSVYSKMLGKQLGSNNYTFWDKKRRQTYRAPLGLSKDGPILDDLTVSRTVAERTYNDLKIYYQIRMLLFLNVLALSKNND